MLRRYLFYVWVIAILTFCVFAVLFATARLWEGLQATYEVRLQTIKDLVLYVGTGIVYWSAAAIIYLLLMLFCYPDWHAVWADWEAGMLWSLMGLTIASKGGLNAVVWHLTAHRFVVVEKRQGTGAAERKSFGAFGVPEALREEWLSYTQLGIRLAVAAAEEAASTHKSHPLTRVLMLPSIRHDTDSRISSTRDPPRAVNVVQPHAARGRHSATTSAASSVLASSVLNSGSLLGSQTGRERLLRADFASQAGYQAGYQASYQASLGGGGGVGAAARAAAAAVRVDAAAELCDVTSLEELHEEGLGFVPRLVRRFHRLFSSSAWMAFFAGGGPPFKFVEHHPGDFRALREADGVRPDVYLASLISGGQVGWLLSPSDCLAHLGRPGGMASESL